LNPDISTKQEDIIHRLLEKDRDLRYQSAADLRSEFKAPEVRHGIEPRRAVSMAFPITRSYL
jgi:hypothetical protein